MKYAGKEYPKNIVTMIDSALEYVVGASVNYTDDDACEVIEEWIDTTFGEDGDRDYYPLESESDRRAAIEAAQEIYINAKG